MTGPSLHSTDSLADRILSLLPHISPLSSDVSINLSPLGFTSHGSCDLQTSAPAPVVGGRLAQCHHPRARHLLRTLICSKHKVMVTLYCTLHTLHLAHLTHHTFHISHLSPSLLTYHTSLHTTFHTLHLTNHISHITHSTSQITSRTLHHISHISHSTPHISPFNIIHLTHITVHIVSQLTPHISHTSHISLLISPTSHLSHTPRHISRTSHLTHVLHVPRLVGGDDGGESLCVGKFVRGRTVYEVVGEAGQTLGHTAQDLHTAVQVSVCVHACSDTRVGV